ncbi:hypothetical protein [Sphingomonas sp.]|uniref:hypothetical protein n=1 Tax=Sphingomonas sp. TaxID=28214 RepID=UPI0025FF89DE|nr:hypothetical protein [Sphingomonas sp.]
MVGFLLANAAGEKISKGDERAHGFALLIAIIILLADIAASPLGSTVTWTRLGAVIAAIVDWRTSGASLRKTAV